MPQAARGPGRPAGSQAGEGREALLRAARELLAERGMPRVTLRAVAARAGVQPALIHYYFGGKRDLFETAVAEVVARLRACVREAVAREGSPEDRIRGLIGAVVRALAEEPYAPRLLVEQMLYADADVLEGFADHFARANLESVRGVLEEGRASGVFRRVDPLFFMPSAIGAMSFFFLAAPVVCRLFKIGAITPELAANFATSSADLLLHGIARQEPRA
jgi:TetR/AcrR family transcriptional regulator